MIDKIRVGLSQIKPFTILFCDFYSETVHPNGSIHLRREFFSIL